MDLLHTIRGEQLTLQAELGDLYQNQSGYVFTDSLGRPIDSNRLSREFTRIVKAANLPPLTLHGLRHAMASLMLSEGVHLKVVSDRLDHSNIATTTDIYPHLLPGLQEQAAQALDRRLSQDRPESHPKYETTT